MKFPKSYSSQHWSSDVSTRSWTKRVQLGAAVLMWLACFGCGKKTDVAKAPPPPPPPAPTASITASPSTVQAGQAVTLRWDTQNATEVRIEPLGSVELSGSKQTTPTQSVTYHLVAKGPGGSQEMSARVTVVAVSAAPAAPAGSEEQPFAATGGRQDVFFDLDTFLIRADQSETIQHDVEFLKQHPDLEIVIEGHCDELGSAEYNLALGESRANQVKSALVQGGIDGSRIETLSYGKEHPFCAESNEDCWKQNRRAHIVAKVEQPR